MSQTSCPLIFAFIEHMLHSLQKESLEQPFEYVITSH